MRGFFLFCFRIIGVAVLYVVLSGLSIITLNYQSPDIMMQGERAINFGVSGAFLNGSMDPVSEELQIGTRFGWSDISDIGLKVYVSSGKGGIARGWGIYGDGRFFGFEEPLFTLSAIIGLSYARCRIRGFEDDAPNNIFGLHGSVFFGKRIFYGGLRENIEFTWGASGQLGLGQHIGCFIGGMIGKKHSVTPEICYYYSGLGRDFNNARNDYVVGIGYQYTFR